MRSITSICNEAIGDLPAHPITGLTTDDRKEARECARFLPGVVSELIAVHDWQHVRKRIALSEIENDRPGEWAKAYSLPNKTISPIELIPNYAANNNSDLSLASGGTSSNTGTVVLTPVLFWHSRRVASDPIDYEVADGKLYTNLDQAILEYSIDELDPSRWTPLFAQAVIRLLAARIYRPILGEKADTNEVAFKLRMAMAAKDEAVADDLNRNPRQRKEFISDAEIAITGTGQVGGDLWRR